MLAWQINTSVMSIVMIDTNFLVLNDNVSFLKSLPDNGIDFSVTSPPYDNLRDYSGTYSLDIKGLEEQLYRVRNQVGPVYGLYRMPV